MKRQVLFFILFLPALLSYVGCSNNGSVENMSNEEILKVLDVKIHKHPKDDKLLYDRAKIYMQMNRINEAIADLTRAVSLNGKEYDYHMLLGDAYFANGDVEHSYKSLQDALNLKPNSQEAYLKLGEIAYYSRDYDRAMDNLSKVTAKDPQNRTALFMKGFIYKETGDTANAVVLLRKVCDLYPEYEPAFEELGMLYANRHDPLALEYLNTAIRLEPQNTNALYGLAMFHQIYKQILDINDNDKHAWHNRGYIQLFTYGDYDLAIQYFTRAIQCDSSFIEAWTNRGCAQELKGNKSLAIDDFRAALDLDHTFQPAIDGMNRNK